MRDNDALQDTASDGHVAGERTLLIDVGVGDSVLGGLEAQTDVLIVTVGLKPENTRMDR